MLLHQPMNRLSAFVVSHLSHATGVHDTDVSHLASLCLPHPVAHEFLRHTTCLREVQFTSQCEKRSLLALQYARIYHVSFKFVAKVRKIIVSLHHQIKLFNLFKTTTT
jgi:hypothetical protein